MTDSAMTRSFDTRSSWALGGASRSKVDLWISVLLAIAALGLLRAWRYPCAYPGEAVRLLAEQAGLWPQLSPQAPVWNALARWLASLGAAEFHFRLQWLGHWCAAATVGLLYRLILLFIEAALDDDSLPRWSAFVARLAAAGSAVFLLVCPPVWAAAQSPHPAVFGLLLAIGASVAAGESIRRASIGLLLVWAALAGIGVVESPLVLMLLPAWLLILVLRPFGPVRSEGEGPGVLGTVLATGIFAVVAGATFLAGAYAFRGSEGFVLRGFGRLLNVLVHFWTDYLGVLKGALPSMGWLVIVLGLLTPCVLVMVLSRRVQNGEMGPGLAFLYLVLVPTTVMQVAGSTVLRIWTLLPSAVLQTGACLVSATTFGLVAAAWLLVAGRCVQGMRTVSTKPQKTPVAEAVVPRISRAILAGIVGFGMLLAVFGSVLRRAEVPERAALRSVAAYARQVAEDAGDSRWVVTDGLLDHQVRLAAWRAGRRLDPLPLPAGQDVWTRRAVARRLPDENSRSLFAISTYVLLRDWLEGRTELAKDVSVQIGYDIWLGTRVALAPRRSLFHPDSARATASEAESLLDWHLPFWKEWRTRLSEAEGCQDAGLAQSLGAVRRQLACVANELGVRLEDEDRVPSAVMAYTAARELNPDNLSARLNLLTLARRQVTVPRVDDLESEIRQLAVLHSHSTLLNVVRLHGNVRNARIQASLGAGLALGSAPDASARVESALNLLPQTSRDGRRLRAIRAGLRWRGGDAEGGRAEYVRLLLERPNDVDALLGLAVFEARGAGLDVALPLIDRAKAAGGDPLVCDQLRATLCLESGDTEAAAAVLEPYAQGRKANAEIWYLLAQTALASDDPAGVAVARAQLERYPNTRTLLALLSAQEAERSGDLRSALAYARIALTDAPGDQRILGSALRLSVELGDYEQAVLIARPLLGINPANGLANYAVGTYRLLAGDAKAAEGHLARCVQVSPSVPAYNNLANARLQLNKLDEARRDAETATRMAPAAVAVWDTLAAVALAQVDVAAAKDAANRVLALAPLQPSSWLRAGEAALAAGDPTTASAFAERIAAGETVFDSLSGKRLERLREALRAPRSGEP